LIRNLKCVRINYTYNSKGREETNPIKLNRTIFVILLLIGL